MYLCAALNDCQRQIAAVSLILKTTLLACPLLLSPPPACFSLFYFNLSLLPWETNIFTRHFVFCFSAFEANWLAHVLRVDERWEHKEQQGRSLSSAASSWSLFMALNSHLDARGQGMHWERTFSISHLHSQCCRVSDCVCACVCVCVFWGFLRFRFLLKCSLWRCRCCCCCCCCLNSTLWVLKTADRPHWQIDECLCCLLPASLCPSPSHSLSLSLCLPVCLHVCLSRCLALCCFSPRTIYICSLSILMKIFWKCAIFLLRHTIYGRTGQKHAKKIAECSWKWHEWRSCSLACLVPENRWQFEINLVQSDWDLWLLASN